MEIGKMNYEEVRYKKPCLSQVIIRVDFLEFIDVDTLFGSDIEKEVLKNLPKKGMQQMIRFQTMNMIADSNGTRAEQTMRDGIQQEFFDSNGNKIALSNKYITIEINKYTKYEDVMKIFMPVLKTLLDKTQLTLIRTGIRYINFFGEDSIKPQKNFFSANIGALLDTRQVEQQSCIRSMAMNEYIIDDMHLNFRFGMYNPQYPQPIKKQNFVLDYDCFCDDAIIGFETLLAHINMGHNLIQSMFEQSITSQLRTVMNNG